MKIERTTPEKLLKRGPVKKDIVHVVTVIDFKRIEPVRVFSEVKPWA